ncbi:hypothetical protein QJS10_CPB12g00910 [Acorus calamus]|uniref:Uncharacterized protein n=1 Tax=Acorus calamus TaxID=4465 RepID=A0AAV9DL75_ACOCL|nr:hypothetical protein QJS10_CPB12g00910 [Acorus calamus]
MKEEILRLEQSHQASNIEETEILLNKLAVTVPVDEDISEKLKKAEEELDDLKQDMKLKREEIDKLRCEKVADLTCKLDALNNEIQRITKERDMLEGSNVQLRAANEGLKLVVESKDAKIEELKVKTREYVNYERWRMSNVVGMLEGMEFDSAEEKTAERIPSLDLVPPVEKTAERTPSVDLADVGYLNNSSKNHKKLNVNSKANGRGKLDFSCRSMETV